MDIIGSMLIDVRSPEEFAAEHAPGAHNVPLEGLQFGELGALSNTPKDEEVLLYCRSGGRAGFAEMILNMLGFTNVKNIGCLEDAQKYVAE